MLVRAIAGVMLAAAAACGSTSPDVSQISESGTYSLSSQELAPGAPAFTTGDATIFNTDVYVLSGGTWSRTYTATSVSPSGTRTPFSGKGSGTYTRAISEIYLRSPGQPDLTANFSGSALAIIEGNYRLTYVRN